MLNAFTLLGKTGKTPRRERMPEVYTAIAAGLLHNYTVSTWVLTQKRLKLCAIYFVAIGRKASPMYQMT